MTTRAYSRCHSGHYFMGDSCPFDGWASPASRELTEAVERLTRAGRSISMAELTKAGLSPTSVARTIVIDFGSAESAFEAISPKECSVGGVSKPPMKLGPHFK